MTEKGKYKRTRGTRSEVVKQVEESANEKIEKRVFTIDDLIPTGSTLLNLACSDNPFGGYRKGKIVTAPGGSSSGKTIAVLSTFADSNKLKRLKDYKFIYDDVEDALEFDMEYLFGKQVAKRIIAPQYDGKDPIFSDTIQDFKMNILRLCKEGQPFIYALDSLDALTSDEELEKEFKKLVAKAKSDEALKEITGSYKTEKAKIMGETLRMIKHNLAKNDSLLITVQQERDKIGATFGKKKTTSGGNAPFFYSTHQTWYNRIQTLKSKGRKIGSRCKVEMTKNKLTGKLRDVEFDIFYDYGIDDIGSCVDFVISEKHWSKPSAQTFDAKELGVTGSRSTIINHIEKNNLEHDLQELTGKIWNEIEESLRLERKRRYE